MTGEAFVNALATLFVTVDPVSLAPIFLALTAGFSARLRRRIAVQAVTIAFAVLVGFILGGRALLGTLGISLASFRIAGGLFLFWTAFEMVFERRQERKSATAGAILANHEENGRVAAFPLAVPLIAGPGSITAVMLIAARANDDPAVLASLVGIAALVLGSCLASMLLAAQIEHLLGDIGRGVVTRLFGVILAALAVQFIADGSTEILRHAMAEKI